MQTMSHLIDVITFGDMCVDLVMTGDDVTPRFSQVEKLVSVVARSLVPSVDYAIIWIGKLPCS